MPAAIDDTTRSEIVFRAALGESQTAIAEATGCSRTTVRKYLDETRSIVEESAAPRERLCAIITESYDWDEQSNTRYLGM